MTAKERRIESWLRAGREQRPQATARQHANNAKLRQLLNRYRRKAA